MVFDRPIIQARLTIIEENLLEDFRVFIADTWGMVQRDQGTKKGGSLG